MVVFSDEPDKYSGPGVLKTLEEELMLTMEFNNRILAMDEEIQVGWTLIKELSDLGWLPGESAICEKVCRDSGGGAALKEHLHHVRTSK